jgi:hypothetical protein
LKFSYPYKVWLTTVLASPFFLMICWGIYNTASFSDFRESAPLILMMIIFGLGLSLPSLWLYKLLYNELADDMNAVLKKLTLALVGISFIWVTFFLFDHDFFKNADFYSLSWPGAYSIVLFASTFVFNMKSETNPNKYKIDQSTNSVQHRL